MKSYEQWKEELDFAVEALKAKGMKHYYGFSLQMSQETASLLKQHFHNKNYIVEVMVCPRKLYDIIIEF